jgi:hypothetical protein
VDLFSDFGLNRRGPGSAAYDLQGLESFVLKIRCFLEKLHDRQGIVEHNIVTTLDGTDYPGGIIFQGLFL